MRLVLPAMPMAATPRRPARAISAAADIRDLMIKASLIAGALVLIAFPARADRAPDCQVGGARAQACIDSGVQPPAPRATPAPALQAAPRAEAQPQRQLPVRRRNSKRIPDAELIGPRGAL